MMMPTRLRHMCTCTWSGTYHTHTRIFDTLVPSGRGRRGYQESILRYSGAVLQVVLNLTVVVLFVVDTAQVNIRPTKLQKNISN